MNVRIPTSAAAVVGSAILAAVWIAAQAASTQMPSAGTGSTGASGQHRFGGYTVVKLRDFGGNEDGGNSINDEGLIAGFTNTPASDARHATL